MKQYLLIVLVISITSFTAFSQEKLIKHKVAKGETITAIAQKYSVEPSAIFELNPDCSRALKIGSVIIIPRSNLKGIQSKIASKTVPQQNIHEVQPKETLFGIAKLYAIALDELNAANPEVAETGLKVGQKIKIPTPAIFNVNAVAKKESIRTELKKEVVQEPQPKSPISVDPPVKTGLHLVLPSETKFGIAKYYGITVAELDQMNPILEKEALKAGQTITVPFIENKVVLEAKVESVGTAVLTEATAQPAEAIALRAETVPENKNTYVHEVLPKETKYGIAKQYGISIADLESQNPTIVKNLYVGAQLSISGTKSISDPRTAPSVIENKTEAAINQENLTIASSLAQWNTSEELADELIRMASDNLGSSYRSGGTSKNGFDCSGLMYATFSSLDIKLPRSSHEMATIGKVVSTNQAQKGDLIFFKTRGGNQINHVGMVVEVCDDEIRFIHSATHGGVIISSTKEKYYEKNFTQINRVLQQ